MQLGGSPTCGGPIPERPLTPRRRTRQDVKPAVDGRGLSVLGRENGFWLEPTLFDHVSSNMSICTDEIFGPVLSIVRVESYG